MIAISNPYAQKAAQSSTRTSLVTTFVLIVLHLMTAAAFFTVRWRNLAVAVFLHWAADGLGSSMGYHRLHTHRGFKTSNWFEYFLAVCGTHAVACPPR